MVFPLKPTALDEVVFCVMIDKRKHNGDWYSALRPRLAQQWSASLKNLARMIGNRRFWAIIDRFVRLLFSHAVLRTFCTICLNYSIIQKIALLVFYVFLYNHLKRCNVSGVSQNRNWSNKYTSKRFWLLIELLRAHSGVEFARAKRS